jgi:hypothetical protein
LFAVAIACAIDRTLCEPMAVLMRERFSMSSVATRSNAASVCHFVSNTGHGQPRCSASTVS